MSTLCFCFANVDIFGLKSKIDDKNSTVHLLDGNGDNYIDIREFINKRGGSIDGNLHDLLKVNNLLLQYGG